MKNSSNRRLLPLILTGLLLGVGISQFSTANSAPAAQDEDHHDEEGPLMLAMEEMQSGMRKLRRMHSDASKSAETVELLRSMQGHLMVAFANTPAAPSGSDAAATAKWSVGFKKKILATTVTLLDMELALSTGDTKHAGVLYKELGAHKKSGHNAYIPDDE